MYIFYQSEIKGTLLSSAGQLQDYEFAPSLICIYLLDVVQMKPSKNDLHHT